MLRQKLFSFLKNNNRSSDRRSFSLCKANYKSAVLGFYQFDGKDGKTKACEFLTQATDTFDNALDKTLSAYIDRANEKKALKAGHVRVKDVTTSEYPTYDSAALCCLGKRSAGYNELEMWDEAREHVRSAVAAGVRQLQSAGEREIAVDTCGQPEAAAEGSHLAIFEYDELKAEDKRKKPVTLSPITQSCVDGCRSTPCTCQSDIALWDRGVAKAEGQNWARRLMEMPANHLTPTAFADTVKERLEGVGCTVTVRDKAWMEAEKMGAFLAVAQGSAEPPLFLEIEYKGAEVEQPIALVGKGVTFDSGGISIKPSQGMDAMRADMGGAACTVGAIYAIAKLKIQDHVKGFIPLCENMPSSRAVKPGDVVTAKNGKTIQVDNTDAEGRMILADALCYAETCKPRLILDMATLTGAIDVALGSAASGVYTNSTELWDLLQKAGAQTGDRVWRMPLFNHYSKQVTESKLADVNNVGKYARAGGSCTGAAFLKEFVTSRHWLHLDIAGVMANKGEVSYLGKGMAGRPTRTIVDFVELARASPSSTK